MGKKNKNQNRTGFWEIFASVYFSKWYITAGGFVLALIAWVCLRLL